VSLARAVLFALTLICLLFGVASIVETRDLPALRATKRRHGAYTLALGVYCSSWTFYGAVGSAARDGWNYLPIYAGPVALLLLAPRFLRRLSEAVAEEKATTISDFIAARFGHDVVMAQLVTIIALAGTIPYVALQLRSIGGAIASVSGQDVAGPTMICAAVLLGLFAILFGARRYEIAGRSDGLLYAIGFESVLKMLALVSVGALAVVLLWRAPPGALAQSYAMLGSRFAPSGLSVETLVILIISTCAVIVLPRQFYMGLVEAQSPEDLPNARFGLAAYIAAMAAIVVPIAAAGAGLLPHGEAPDLFVLRLPGWHGDATILTLALLGGMSAAAAMVIVDATALATMISNDLVFAAILRGGAQDLANQQGRGGEIGKRMLMVRRGSILAVVALALAWALLLSPRTSLASIGLVAFAAMAQFTPHLILGVFARDRDPLAGRISLTIGFVLWLYTLALPQVLPLEWLAGMRHSLFDPLHLFGIGNAPPLVHGVAWSLGANLAAFAFVAVRKMPRQSWMPSRTPGAMAVHDIAGLVRLTASFVGAERADAEFAGQAPGAPVDRKAAGRAQQLIARVVGVSSARALMASALAGGTMSLAEVTRLLDAGGQSLRFSRQLLAATFENVDAGISVVDSELNLIAWNTRYEELFDYPAGLVRVGEPVADLIRHNAARGDFGDGDIETHVQKRLEHLRRGTEHSFERHRRDGRVIKTVGGPMPDGGYVMSFTDITGEWQARAELQRTLVELESRVADRTSALSEANERLARATRDKTRFLAAASHDLLQPLHAARLFTAALERQTHPAPDLVKRVERSIIAAEDLLRALLDISRLDAGGIQPTPEVVELAPFLRDLVEGVRPIAAAGGLALRYGPLPGVVETDLGLLRSVIQNFLSNALRYTVQGGVLVGVRMRAGGWRIDVIDTGVGIAPEDQLAIFGEFTRLGTVEAEGLGLGLAMVDRIARLLGARVELSSVPARGSRFSLWLPASSALPAPAALPRGGAAPGKRSLTVLVVDNEPEIVEASAALLSSLGHLVFGARGLSAALKQVGPHAGHIDAVLADHHLDDGEDGLSLIAELRRRRPGLPAALVTAAEAPDVLARAAQMGVPVLRKPVAPEAIEAFLAGVSALGVAAE